MGTFTTEDLPRPSDLPISDYHLYTASHLNRLAESYCQRQRYEAAEKLAQRALAIQQQDLGRDHPETVISLNNLAMICEAMGRYAEAEAFYLRALEIRQDFFGLSHLWTAKSLINLALFYNTIDRLPQAILNLNRAVRILEEILWDEHPELRSATKDLQVLVWKSKLKKLGKIIPRPFKLLKRAIQL